MQFLIEKVFEYNFLIMDTDNISRRTFLKTSLAIGAGCYGIHGLQHFGSNNDLKVFKNHSLKKGVVVARIGETETFQNKSDIDKSEEELVTK